MHLSGLLWFLYPGGGLLAALVLWLIQRKKSSYLNQNGKEAVNFQISITACYLVIVFYFQQMGWIKYAINLPVKHFLLFAVNIGAFLFPMIAGIQVGKGTEYKYPLSFRFL